MGTGVLRAGEVPPTHTVPSDPQGPGGSCSISAELGCGVVHGGLSWCWRCRVGRGPWASICCLQDADRDHLLSPGPQGGQPGCPSSLISLPGLMCWDQVDPGRRGEDPRPVGQSQETWGRRPSLASTPSTGPREARAAWKLLPMNHVLSWEENSSILEALKRNQKGFCWTGEGPGLWCVQMETLQPPRPGRLLSRTETPQSPTNPTAPHSLHQPGPLSLRELCGKFLEWSHPHFPLGKGTRPSADSLPLLGQPNGS